MVARECHQGYVPEFLRAEMTAAKIFLFLKIAQLPKKNTAELFFRLLLLKSSLMIAADRPSFPRPPERSIPTGRLFYIIDYLT